MEAYPAHDAAWFAQRSAELGERYLTWLDDREEPALAHDPHIPWFNFQVTGEKGLPRVLTHSAQHRAQTLSVLGAKGLRVPDLDCVSMRAGERSREST
jgi:hypothetical protein